MAIRKIRYFFLFIVLTNPLYSQLKYADVLFEEQNYVDAIPLYERVIDKKGESREVVENLAYCYKIINDYDNAEKYYAKAVSFEDATASSYLYYGQLLKSSNKINQARNQFSKYIELNPGSLVGKLMLKSCDNIKDWSSQPVEFKIKNLKKVNTPLNEIGPFPYKDGIIFTSEFAFFADEKEKKKEEDVPAYSIYFAPLINGEPGEIASFFGRNSTEDFEGPAYLNKTEDLVFFNKVFDTRRFLINQIKIYSSKYENGVWSEPEPFYLSNNKYTVTNPVISFSGDTLFFASDMEGGYGGMDIYYCVKFNGEWGKAVNVGPLINTDGIEIPSYYNGKKTLFFSSNFHPGYGGFDVFKAEWDGITWSTPVNLKSPLNSTKDELGFVPISKNAGFFSSNRDGGFGLDDIYSFGMLDTNDLSNYTTVSGVFEYNNLPLENVTLSLLDENDVLIQSALTNSKGEFEFSGIPPGENYQIIVDEPEENIPDEAKLYLTNSKHEKVKLLSQIRKGLFKFEALKIDEYDNLAVMEVEDDDYDRLTILGEVYNKLTADLPSGVNVLILDDQKNILAEAETNEQGQFKVDNLRFSNEFLFRLTQNDPDLEINVLNQNKELIAATVRNEEGDFVYLTNIQKSVKNPDVTGVFKYGKLPAGDVRLNLMDENDEMLQFTKTDKEGAFRFSNLEAGSNYNIQVDPSERKVPKNARLFLQDAATGRLLPVAGNAKGGFNFKTLAYIEPEELALKEVRDEDAAKIDLRGEIYHQLSGTLPENLDVFLLKDDGTVAATARALPNGKFEFKDLVQKDLFLFRLSNKDPDLKLKMMNTDGELIGVATQRQNGDFEYLTNLQKAVKNPNIEGVFRYGKLAASDVQLNLLNEKDEMLQFTRTDAEGKFEFDNLDAGLNYAIQVDKSAGTIPSNANMSLKDQKTGRLLPVSKFGDGTFMFQTLAYDEADDLTTIEVIDEDDLKMNLFGEIYHKLSMDLPEDLEVYIVDDEGNIIATAKALDNGRFEFENIVKRDEFMLRLSNKDRSLDLKIINQRGQLIGTTSRTASGDFLYESNLINSAKNPDIAGVFKYGKLPASDVQLNLMNDKDEMVQFTHTDSKGEFEFLQLNAGVRYSVQVDQSEGEVPPDAEMFIRDRYTGRLLPVAKMGKGTFSFETLAYDEPEELSLKPAIDKDPGVKRSFLTEIDYQTLPYDLSPGMELLLIDDEDRIISRTKVGKDGTYKFTNYEISSAEIADLEKTAARKTFTIKAKDGTVIAKIGKNELGKFAEIKSETDTKKVRPGTTSSVTSENTIYFDFSSYDLSLEAVQTIDGIIQRLKADKSLKVIIKTHTDSRGGSQYNQWLSQRRANLVLQYLILEEVEYNRIELEPLGETQLSNRCNDTVTCTEKEHAENRRAEFVLKPR